VSTAFTLGGRPILRTGVDDAERAVVTPSVLLFVLAESVRRWAHCLAGAIARFDATQHVTTNHQVTVDGNRATCRCQLHSQHVFHSDNGDQLFTVGGYYNDTFVRTEDGWRISHRTMEQTWMLGSPVRD
jgi:hypothetical protein